MTIAGKESKERKIPTELITSGRRAGRKRERAIFPRNATKEREREKKKEEERQDGHSSSHKNTNKTRGEEKKSPSNKHARNKRTARAVEEN